MTRRSHLTLGATLLVGLTALFWFSDLDLRISSWFYQAVDPHWPLHDNFPWGLLKRWGEFPGLILGLGSLGVLIASFHKDGPIRWRQAALYITLVFALGPGLLVNGVFKNMGRQRPYSIGAFGGSHTFTRPFVLGRWGHGDSFISGHVSMAYLFLALAFLVRGRWRKPAFMAAITFGLAMSVTRVVQGDHFASDVLLCGAIIYLLCAALLPVLRGGPWEHR